MLAAAHVVLVLFYTQPSLRYVSRVVGRGAAPA